MLDHEVNLRMQMHVCKAQQISTRDVRWYILFSTVAQCKHTATIVHGQPQEVMLKGGQFFQGGTIHTNPRRTSFGKKVGPGGRKIVRGDAIGRDLFSCDRPTLFYRPVLRKLHSSQRSKVM